MKNTEVGFIEGDLDQIDWILISAVQQNARVSFAELGRLAGISAPAAAERLRKMEDAGVITGYHAQVNPERFGLTLPALMEIEMKRSQYPAFQKAIQDLNWVLECQHVTGRASFLMKVAVPNVGGLEQLIGHMSPFGSTQTSLILSTVLPRRQFVKGK